MKNLIMDMFNVDSNDIDKFDTSNNEDGTVEIIIRLKRKRNLDSYFWVTLNIV